MKKEITFIVNRSEITAGTRGASLGPDAIFTAARAKNSTFFNGFEMLEIPAYNNLLDQPVKHPFAKRIEGLINIYSALSQTVSTELLNDKFPFILAGDHGSAGGTIAGIKVLIEYRQVARLTHVKFIFLTSGRRYNIFFGVSYELLQSTSFPS